MSTKPIIVPVIVDDKTGQAFIQLNDKILQMKSRTSETMNQVRSDTERARASIALLGEDIGIKIPRHLQTLIAESELARGALTAAFGGIALVAFIDVLEKVPDAIQKGTDALAGWGKAEKDSYAQAVKDNQEQIKYLAQIQQLQRNIVLDKISDPAARAAMQAQFSAEDVGTVQSQLDAKVAAWKAATAKVSDLQKQQAELAALPSTGGGGFGIGGMVGNMSDFDGQIKNATADAEKLRQEVEALQKQAAVTGLGATKDQIDAQKTASEEQKKADEEWLNMRFQMWAADLQHDKDVIASAKAKADAIASQTQYLASVVQTASTVAAGPFDDMAKQAETLTSALKAEKAEETAIAEQMKQTGADEIAINQKLQPLRTKTAADLKAIADQYMRMAQLSKDPALIENAKKFEAEIDAMKIKAQSLSSVLTNDFLKQGLAALQGIATQTKSVSQAFKDMALSIIQEIEKMIVEWLFFKAISGIMSFAAGPEPSVASVNSAGLGSLSSLKFPGFASGGDFSAGSPMIVGENGPELMVPSSAGSIVPNSKLGGNTYNIDARGSSPGVERDIMRAIKASEDRAVVRSVRTLDSRAKRRG